MFGIDIDGTVSAVLAAAGTIFAAVAIIMGGVKLAQGRAKDGFLRIGLGVVAVALTIGGVALFQSAGQGVNNEVTTTVIEK